MTANRVASLVAVGVAMLLLVPATAGAQQASGIAGVVRDTSGGVLPGVTVEASSPALIEGARTVFTDGEGRYSIVDLRPGTYVVTFTLPGFNTFRREGIVLAAGFTATVNGDLQVGALEETVTVTGEAPLVDTQRVVQSKVVSEELIAALPSGSKGHMELMRLIPGMYSDRNQGGGGAQGIYAANATHGATLHGKGSSKVSFDGMQVNNLAGTGAVSYVMNPSMSVETIVESGGISAESNASGVGFNMVPKEGGNIVSVGADFTFTNDRLQGSNLNDELRARGINAIGKTLHAYDVNVTVGGPLKRDRLWFFAATRLTGTKNELPGVFVNTSQGTPLPYVPDLGRPAFAKDWLRSQGLRLTWQMNERNKVSVFGDPQRYMTRGQRNDAAPEANTCWHMWPQGLYQATWASPVTTRVLIEAGGSLVKNPFPCTREHVTQTYGFAVKPTDVSILEASTGFRYNAASSYSYRHKMDRYVERFSVSYITGSHAFKGGVELQQHLHDTLNVVNEDVNYTYNRGVPTRIRLFATPHLRTPRTRLELGLFFQDRWAFNRMTLSYGVRFEYFNAYNPEQHVPAGRFVGARSFPKVENVPNWTDLNPRLGVSYDLFGTGRTALKTSIGRYVGKHGVNVALAANPITTSVTQTDRTWNDVNRNYVPDCDLANFTANGECGPIDNLNFGNTNPNALRYADDITRGFGKRDYFWDFAAEVQHELRPGMSVSGGYYRSWTDHFGTGTGGQWPTGVRDNLAIGPADFDPFCITAPVDRRLPGGGGYQVCGLYDITPQKFGIGNEVIERASKYGPNSRTTDFFSLSINTRFGDGIQLGGSVDVGQTIVDQCFVVDSPQQLLHCRNVTPFRGQTQLKAHAVYPAPYGFVASAVLQNVSGSAYAADYQVPNDAIAPSLGRNLAACGARTVCSATVQVPLLAPNQQFEPRRTVLDLRLSKLFSIGQRRTVRANFDVYNVLNNASILEVNNNYGASWRQGFGRVGGVMVARLVQVGAQLTF